MRPSSSCSALRDRPSSASRLREAPRVSFHRPSSALRRPSRAGKAEVLKARFKELDVNGDGLLDMDEFATLLNKGGGSMPEAKVKLLFDSIDVNNDGVVSFDEFVDFIYSTEKEQPPEFTGESPKARPSRPRASTAPADESDVARPMASQDVDLLMASLTEEQRGQLDQPWAVAEARRRFLALSKTAGGSVAKAKLRAELTSVFPGVEEELLICRGCRLMPLSSSLAAVMAVFDRDCDGRLSQDEFLPLARFCQAWCIHKNFNSDAGSFSLAVTKRNSRRRLVTMNLQDLSSTAPAVLANDRQLSPERPASAMSSCHSDPESSHPRGRSRTDELRSVRLLDDGDSEEDAQSPLSRTYQGSPSNAAARNRSRKSSSQESLSKTLPAMRPRPMAPSAQEVERRRKREKEKLDALTAIVEFEKERSLDDLAFFLFHPVIDQDSRSMFSREQIQAAVDHVRPPAPEGAEAEEDSDFGSLPPPSKPARRASTAPAPKAKQPASRRRASAIMCAPMAEIAKVPSLRGGRTADSLQVPGGKMGASRSPAVGRNASKKKRIDVVIEILNLLAETFQMMQQALLAQVLWRHRMCQCLQTPKFNKALDDICWVVAPDVYEDVAFIFEFFTKRSKGKMDHEQFQKSIMLVQKNSVLKSHIRLTDSDRVWKHLTNKDGVQTVGFNQYVRLVLDLAETCCASPWMIFNSLACHVGTLSDQDIND